MSTLQWRFDQFIAEQQLCHPTTHRIVVAVSGGKDSMLLLHLLMQSGYEIGIAHCNFNLRGEESDLDEALVQELAQTHNIPFFVKQFQTSSYAEQHGVSTQMAARTMRYAWFHELCASEGFDYIAVAHHATDQIETILINQLRGTGMRGMSGMDPKNGIIIRPLLFLTSDEIADAVQALNIRYRDDQSNFSTHYWRNKIRLEVLPILRAMNPDLEHTFLKNAQAAQDAQTFIEARKVEFAEQYLKQIDQQIHMDLRPFLLDPSNKIILHELLQPYGFGGTLFNDIWRTLTQTTRTQSGQQFFSSEYQLLVNRETAVLKPILQQENGIKEVILTEPNSGHLQTKTVPVRNYEEAMELVKLHANDPHYALFDADLIPMPLHIRSWKEGDVFKPFGMQGKQKKISDYFTQIKLSRWQKDEVPLMVDANGRILWVIPYRMSSDYNISTTTRNVMVISYFCQNGG